MYKVLAGGRRSRLVVLTVFFGVTASFLPTLYGQPTEANTKTLKFAFITNAVSPFWQPMMKGMERAAQKLGVEVTWQGPPNGQVAEQRRLLENAMAQGVDGICVSVIDAKAITPVINNLVESGIKLITMDSDAPESKRIAYIGTNNYQAGLEAGKTMVSLMPKGGKVMAFVGTLSADNARDSLQGFIDATKGHNIQLVDTLQDQTDKAKARRNVEDALQAHPDLVGLLGLWSYNGPAIAAAVKEAKKRNQVKIVCFDAEPNTLRFLESGDIDATIVQKPYYFGYLGVMLLHNLVTCGDDSLMLLPKDRLVDTGVQVVTPQNLQQYKDYLKSLGIESS